MSQLNPQSNMAAMVESAINKEQKEKLADILKHVSKLTDLEKLYLYLKLPSGHTIEEPTKKSCSLPLASANRTSTTLTWIKSHYVEDEKVCLPKQEVYNQYRLYCEATNTHPVGSADFGKMVKTAFPNIHHRRLGQRGKSKYCYGGLKRKTQVEIPTLPVLQTKPSENVAAAPNPLQEMQNLSSQLVCEWACRLFDKKFTDLKSVAQYLIQTGASYGKKAALFSMMYDTNGSQSRLQDAKSSDLQDTQALLQRKLHQKEVLKGHLSLLKQLQNCQREVKSSPISRSETVTGHLDTKYFSSKCAGNVVSGDQCKIPTKLLPCYRSVSANIVGNYEKVAHTITNCNKTLGSDDSAIGTSDGNLANGDFGVYVNVQDRFLPRDIIHPERDRHKMDKRVPVVNQPSRELSISMSISSDSLSSEPSPLMIHDGDDHKHQKRMSDVLAGHDRVSKRRRCMTSLGVPHQESTEDLANKNSTIATEAESRIRPISCPTLCDTLSSDSGMRNKDIFTLRKKHASNYWKEKGNQKGKEKHRALNNSDPNWKKSSHSSKSVSKETEQNTKNDKSTFHFVQKPTVIAVRQPGRVFPSVMSCPNFTSSQKFEQVSHESPSDIKKSHNILNTLLSTTDDADSTPKPLLSTQTSISTSLPLSMQHLDGFDNRLNQQGQKLPHTLDNAYILSSQSSRSAFVPVASNKLQDSSRSRSSHPCLNMYSPSRCSSTERPNMDAKPSLQLDQCDRHVEPLLCDEETLAKANLPPEDESKHISGDSSHSIFSEGTSLPPSVPNCSVVDTLASDHFQPITYSTNQTGVRTSTVARQSSVTPTPLTSTSPMSQAKASTQMSLSSTSSTTTTSKQSAKTGTKSPVTLPRRQSRSRFTPIRPKMSGCAPSPQKKDMRPVSMILKEQRVRNAQELLVNIASSYQGEVKLQMPAELLGLSPPGKSKSSDVLVTIGTPDIVSSKQVPNVLATPQTKVLEHQSQNTCNIIQSVSSMLSRSSKPNTEVISLPALPVDEQCNANIPISKTGVNVNLMYKSILNSQDALTTSITNTLKAPLAETNDQDKKLVIADSNGLIYTLDKDSQPFPFSQNAQSQFHTEYSNTPGIKLASTKTPGVINIADINGQVVGPDDTGQKYLIIPRSVSALESQNYGKASSMPSVTSCPMAASISKENQNSFQTLSSTSGVSSSSALLTELSQLASASKQEKTQTLIQHDSTLSAFHKCGPNKPQIVKTTSSQGPTLHSNEGSSDFNLENKICITDQIKPLLPKRPSHCTTDADSGNQQLCSVLSSSKDSDVSQGHSVRKRKASKSREECVKDKKRQNTSEGRRSNEDDDVLIVDVERESADTACNGRTSEPVDLFDKSYSNAEHASVIEKSLSIEGKLENDFSDTDALLEMIGGSRSLTVKQTVMAMNSLRAEMRKKLQDSVSGVDTESKTPQLKSGVEASKEGLSKEESQKLCDQSYDANKRNIAENVICPSEDKTTYLHHETSRESRSASKDRIVDKVRLVPKMVRSNKRNMSLNLESLESDALLDSELTLDHRLMCDVGEGKANMSDSKTSVAVAAKSSHSNSLHKQEGNGKKPTEGTSTYSTTADTSRSRQAALNEKKSRDTEREKESNVSSKEMKQLNATKHSKGQSRSVKTSSTASSGALTLPRRSVSCVRDILQRSSSSYLDPLKLEKLKTVEKSYGADYFDALLSKLQSKPGEALLSESRTKPQARGRTDLDIPLDVVDFVTESMSSRSMYNYPSARCLSVPNTKPDFLSLNDSFNRALMQRHPSSDMSDTGGSVSNGSNIFLFDQKQRDSLSDKMNDLAGVQSDEQTGNEKQNVFLSPVGPAKLARRLSVEKSVSQPLIDRAMMKTPVEFSSSRQGPESSPMKSNSGMKAPSTDRQSARTPVDRLMTHTERKRAKTPFDPTMNNQFIEKKNGKQQGPVSQSTEDLSSSKPPVNRSLTRTPLDKFFQKIVSDSLLSKYQVENLSQQCARDQTLGQDDNSSSQTPTSDAGYGSVSETPVSDFGYNSISPSPVMMSSSSFFGECGRRDLTSPATIFMPLRSDSALSLNNNITSDHHVCTTQTNLTEMLPSVANQFDDNFSDGFHHSDTDISDSSTLTQNSLSSSSRANKISLQSSLENDPEKNESNNSDEMTDLLDFSKLVSPSLHSIPTPPFSPNSTLMSTAPSTLSPLPFNIPFSPLPNHDSSPSPPSMPRFLLPCSTSANFGLLLPYHQSSTSPRHSFPQDQQIPCISHVLTPSPHILARPPSSPHHFGTHPSPPFTPSSQRSLPSPCPTPSSFKSLISPRSLTPSVDSSQVPNAFMPIQSSCVQTASLAPTHTYIQPIKPVVTLASPSSHVAGNETLAQTSDSSSGILSSFVEVLQKNRSHVQSRSSPAASETRHISNLKSSGDHLSCTPRLTSPFNGDLNSLPTVENDDNILSEKQTDSGKLDQMQTKFDSRKDDHSTLDNAIFQQMRMVEPSDIVSQHSQHILPKSFFSSRDLVRKNDVENVQQTNQHDNQQFLTKEAATNKYPSSMLLDNLTIPHKETLHLSPSSTQVLSQTDSPFSAVPSKLQVDLTKLESSQNPTSLVHSKPFQTGQCKINLDICHTSTTIQNSSASQSISSASSVSPLSLTNPGSVPFDSRKAKYQSSSFENFVHLEASSVSSLTSKTAWNDSLSKPSCQDDLQATLEVLRDMDSQYFPCDDDSSNSGSAPGT